MRAPRVLFTVSAEAHAVFDVAEVIVNDAEHIVRDHVVITDLLTYLAQQRVVGEHHAFFLRRLAVEREEVIRVERAPLCGLRSMQFAHTTAQLCDGFLLECQADQMRFIRTERTTQLRDQRLLGLRLVDRVHQHASVLERIECGLWVQLATTGDVESDVDEVRAEARFSGEDPQVIVVDDVADRFARARGVRVFPIRRDELDLQAGGFDRLPLRHRLFDQRVVCSCDLRVGGVVLHLFVRLRDALRALDVHTHVGVDRLERQASCGHVVGSSLVRWRERTRHVPLVADLHRPCG